MRASIIMGVLALGWAGSAAAQSGAEWTVAQEKLDTGDTAIVLARVGPRGRAEVRAISDRRRAIGVFGDQCASSSEYFADDDADLRRSDIRTYVAALIGPEDCRLTGDVMTGFDEGYARFEAMLAMTPLPPAQAWMPGITGYEASREVLGFTIKYEVADLQRKRTGHAVITVGSKDCKGDMEFFYADVTAPGTAGWAETARAAVAAKVDEAIKKCGSPAGTAERLMAGFGEAVAREETKLAADLAKT